MPRKSARELRSALGAKRKSKHTVDVVDHGKLAVRVGSLGGAVALGVAELGTATSGVCSHIDGSAMKLHQ